MENKSDQVHCTDCAYYISEHMCYQWGVCRFPETAPDCFVTGRKRGSGIKFLFEFSVFAKKI